MLLKLIYITEFPKMGGLEMAIEQFYGRPETDVVTLTRAQLSFSASLVRKLELLKSQYVRIGVDPELRRIYFSFQKDPGLGLLKVFQAKGKSSNRHISTGRLYAQYDWIGRLKDEKELEKRQFLLEDVDPSQDDIYPEWKYFITLGYSWSEERDFQDQSQYPEESGVYRLKREGVVVRIGEGKNIAERLKEHLKTYGSKIDTFDFEIVPNQSERAEEQKRLLNEFKAAVGRLPEENPIAN